MVLKMTQEPLTYRIVSNRIISQLSASPPPPPCTMAWQPSLSWQGEHRILERHDLPCHILAVVVGASASHNVETDSSAVE